MDDYILRDFPQIVPLNSNLTEFDGFVTIKNREIRVRLSIKNGMIEINSTWKNLEMLNTGLHKEALSMSDLNSALNELMSEWESNLFFDADDVDESIISTTYYTNIINYLNHLEAEDIEDIDEDLKHVSLLVLDMKNRKHRMQISFSEMLTDINIEYSLPAPFNFKWEQNSTLNEVVENFKQELNKYQLFWDYMDAIDENYCVLEPENPTRKDCLRRIALNSKVSLKIVVNPLQAGIFPDYTFLGPDDDIEELDQTIYRNRALWDDSIFLMKNISNLLKMDFPRKRSQEQEELLQACGICYSYLLEEAIPNETCSCNQSFHTKCLIEWLRSMPTAGHKFKSYSGECPYCRKSISCFGT